MINIKNLPIDVINNIKDYVIFKPKTKEDLRKAVGMWCSTQNHVALKKYGHISLWNTSLIKDMEELFYKKKILMTIYHIGMCLMLLIWMVCFINV